VYIQKIVSLSNHVDNHFTSYYFCVSQKTKNGNKTYEVEEIESKLQEEQRRNELLQERIDLMKEQLIGSAATDSVGVDVSSILKAHSLFLLIYFCF
jgi:ferritin-like protein